MLTELSIRDVVLIDRLELALGPGLIVLTGETGAGKSILLDALGLALGGRAESGLVRHGRPQATVSAVFDLPPRSDVAAMLAEQGIELSGEPLVLRRVLSSDGRSRAFVNDQPVGVALLRRIGDALVEVQGQFEARGLLDAASHRRLLDRHGGLEALAGESAARWSAWRDAETARAAAAEETERARVDEDFLRHALGELDALAPRADEEAGLAAQRALLVNAEQLVEAIGQAGDLLAGDRGAEPAVAAAGRLLARVADKAAGGLDSALAAIDRASAELAEATSALEAASTRLEMDPDELRLAEDRLFALRELARKHAVAVDELPALRQRIADRLAAIDDGGERLAGLERAARSAADAYLQSAEALSRARRKAAAALDRAVARELPPLKLEKARFETTIDRLQETEWGPHGLDRVTFLIAANPGAPPGPLHKVASGGELARLLLALKLVLAEADPVATLVFDEVDAGVGGAVAAAVGERLARLGERVQVLVVTHSPQVAARGSGHWRVEKRPTGDTMVTSVERLDESGRREEIARMLSGAAVTDAARAAASSLIAGAAAP